MTEPWEDRLQVALMLVVGAAAAAYSWSNALRLAEDHGQAGWHSWVAAACIETAAISAGLHLRHRRRHHRTTLGPLVILGAAAALQIAVQVEEAERSVWGVIVAVLPTVTFLALVKLALSRPRSSLVHAEDEAVQDEEHDDAPDGALAAALAWIQTHPGPLPGPAQVVEATGVSRSTAKRALKRVQESELEPAPALP